MSASVKIEAPFEADVTAAFDVLAWEIELAGARCIFLDALIGELLPDMPQDKRARLMEGLHAVDLLAQHLTSLSAFSRRMSFDTPAGFKAPVEAALGEISLGALQDRMRTAFGGNEETSPDADSGDLDLF